MRDNIDVLGVRYSVTVVSSMSDLVNDTWLGECHYTQKLIRLAAKDDLDRKVCDDSLRGTLLHEAAHAFLDQTGHTDLNDERHAELLACFADWVQRADILGSLYDSVAKQRDSY